MFFGNKKRLAPERAENHYWMSFSDLMSGILIIFILVCVALLTELMRQKEKYDNLDTQIAEDSRAREAIVNEIANELRKRKIEVFVDENHTIVHIPADAINFDSNKHEIRPDRQLDARNIGVALYNAITKDDRWRHLETVFIEGHTDGVQVEGVPRYNWDLSTQRAVSLWQFWLADKDFGYKLAAMQNKEGMPLFSVSGYADTRRLVKEENNDPERQRRNRRIDLRFTTRQPDLRSIEEIGGSQ